MDFPMERRLTCRRCKSRRARSSQSIADQARRRPITGRLRGLPVIPALGGVQLKILAVRICSVITLLPIITLLAGCSHMKAAGTWVEPAGAAGNETIELKADGTGTSGPGQAIKWTEDGNAIKFFGATEDPATATPVMTGTLSDDQKQLTVTIGGGGITDSEVLTRKD